MKRMARQINFALILSGVLFLSACLKSGTPQTDANELCKFLIPNGWELKSKSSSVLRYSGSAASVLRYVRANAPKERSALVISVKENNSNRTVEAQRKIGLSQANSQGFEILTDEVKTIGEFKVWESEYKTHNRHNRSPMMHGFQMFSGKVHVSVQLIAIPSLYTNYKTDLTAVVKSMSINR